MIILDGKVVADKIQTEVKRRIEEELNIIPTLAVLLVGNDPASQVYVARKQKACEFVGITSHLFVMKETSSTEQVVSVLDQWGKDSHIHGILVQLPLPVHLDRTRILSAINPEKDVDCFHPFNCGLLMHGKARFQPCTPRAVVVILEHYGIETKGKNIAIINRSIVVGQPLSSMLSQPGVSGDATVTLVHEHTRNLADITRRSDIIITAVGKNGFKLTSDMVGEGATVIDVGINRVNGKTVGDVDFENVSKVAGFLTPVPGGCGPVTISILLQNALFAATGT